MASSASHKADINPASKFHYIFRVVTDPPSYTILTILSKPKRGVNTLSPQSSGSLRLWKCKAAWLTKASKSEKLRGSIKADN